MPSWTFVDPMTVYPLYAYGELSEVRVMAKSNGKKWTSAKDDAADKKAGIKPGSKRDNALDKKRGVKT